MKIFNKILSCIIVCVMMFSNNEVLGANSYINSNINGSNVNYIKIDMNNNVKAVVLNANNQMNSSDSLSSMASKAGAFAAINGTYFEAYNGIPVPWGTIIKNGKVLHISNGGSVAGITYDGKLIVDRLSFDFEGYINGQYRAIPWRINHPSTENEAITIFTPEYSTTVNLMSGAKAVVVDNGKVVQILTSDFTVPSNGFAIVYNSAVTHLVDERYKINDEVYYKVKINTTFTDEKEWSNVVSALGAGPSLIINGVITADGQAEGFTEAKINTNSAARSFIGAAADGKVIIGNIGAVTVKQAAEICKQMGLVNAMCLDGGGSIALYHPSANVNISGRKINNGFGFVEEKKIEIIAEPTSSIVMVDGSNVELDAYNINNNNYFKLRDIAMVLKDSVCGFNVKWDDNKNAINLLINDNYTPVGGELYISNENNIKKASLTNSTILVNENNVALTAYNIDGSNYFKLRDIANFIDFEVSWDSNTNTILINTN